MRLSHIIRDYFTFSRNERIGLVVLIFLIIILMVFNQIIFYFEKPTVADEEQFNRFLSELNYQTPKTYTFLTLFSFDPNTIDSLAIDSLNLPVNVKKNLLKYRKSGGSFYSREDIRKIYGMNDSIYNSIAPFVNIESKVPVFSEVVAHRNGANNQLKDERSFETKESQVESAHRLEINSASSEELKTLYGIGDILSVRIVKYRDLLGGFYSLGQLEEVYGLKHETLNGIKPHLIIDPSMVSQININFAKTKDLAFHPYLDWGNASLIVDYISRVGFVEDKNILSTDSVLNDSVLRKVYPYLKTIK